MHLFCPHAILFFPGNLNARVYVRTTYLYANNLADISWYVFAVRSDILIVVVLPKVTVQFAFLIGQVFSCAVQHLCQDNYFEKNGSRDASTCTYAFMYFVILYYQRTFLDVIDWKGRCIVKIFQGRIPEHVILLIANITILYWCRTWYSRLVCANAFLCMQFEHVTRCDPYLRGSRAKELMKRKSKICLKYAKYCSSYSALL